MSPLQRFMNAASAILGPKDDAIEVRAEKNPSAKPQPPVIIRTVWLIAEVDEAIQRAITLSHQVKIAHLNNNAIEVRRLLGLLRRTGRQIDQMAGWIDEQFQREAPNAD